MAIDERCAQILNIILSSKKPVKISDLSKIFNVSCRTIRYDLDKIDVFLKENGLPQLFRKPNHGIQYLPSEVVRQRILKLFEGISNYYYALTPGERRKIILTELFQAKDYLTIGKLVDILCVSRGTVVRDLKKVRKWLLKHNLKLESVPHYGICVKGSEKDLRRAVTALLSENMEIEKALNLLKTPLQRRVSLVTDKQVKKLFCDLNISPIEEAILSAEKQLKTNFTDSAYSGLVIHLAFAVKRIQLGKNIVMCKEELSKLKPTREFAVASSMAAQLEESYNIKIPSDEIGYIAIHLLGSKVTESDIFSNQDWIRLQIITDKIIKSVGKKLDADFSADGELYNGLIKHLEPTIYRLKHDLPLKNPILKEIKDNYYRIFEAVKNSADPLEAYISKKVPDEEIGFIAVHFGAALERNKTVTNNIYNAVVVCGTGVGTAKLLSSRIKNKFSNIRILGTVASRQIEDFNESELDLIISTIPVESKKVPQVTVNPLLPEADVSKIYKFLGENPPKRPISCIGPTAVESLLKTIEKNCVIKNRQELIKDINYILKITNKKKIEEISLAQPMLKDLLTEKTIKLNVKAKTWEEGIRICGQMLINNEHVETEYVDAMIDNVRKLGSYIVFVPGVAMPHARPEDGVRRVCMSLATLKEPVYLNGKLIKLILAFGAVDHYSHIKALSDVMKLFENPFKERLFKAKQVKEVTDTIRMLG